jgi:hypothetical protein
MPYSLISPSPGQVDNTAIYKYVSLVFGLGFPEILPKLKVIRVVLPNVVDLRVHLH